jgi:hypothetical protein
MLIRPLSDIHLEFWPENRLKEILDQILPPLPRDKETVAVIAGDIGLAGNPEPWLLAMFHLGSRFQAVVCVEGNHFYYNNLFFGRLRQWRAKQDLPVNVHLLENESVTVGGVRFIGATLWTDFSGDVLKMWAARRHMADFSGAIKHRDGRLLSPEDTVIAFKKSKRYLFGELEKPDCLATVVVTHHGISPLSIHETYQGNPLNAAFSTDLSFEVAKAAPNIWLHGHTHFSFDYRLGTTRVVVNPLGYLIFRGNEPNPGYQKALVLELPGEKTEQ